MPDIPRKSSRFLTWAIASSLVTAVLVAPGQATTTTLSASTEAASIELGNLVDHGYSLCTWEVGGRTRLQTVSLSLDDYQGMRLPNGTGSYWFKAGDVLVETSDGRFWSVESGKKTARRISPPWGAPDGAEMDAESMGITRWVLNSAQAGCLKARKTSFDR